MFNSFINNTNPFFVLQCMGDGAVGVIGKNVRLPVDTLRGYDIAIAIIPLQIITEIIAMDKAKKLVIVASILTAKVI